VGKPIAIGPKTGFSAIAKKLPLAPGPPSAPATSPSPLHLPKSRTPSRSSAAPHRCSGTSPQTAESPAVPLPSIRAAQEPSAGSQSATSAKGRGVQIHAGKAASLLFATQSICKKHNQRGVSHVSRQQFLESFSGARASLTGFPTLSPPVTERIPLKIKKIFPKRFFPYVILNIGKENGGSRSHRPRVA
jgi:hypothetical protein